MRRWPLIVLVLAVLAVGGRYIYGLITAPDDTEQIRAALVEAIQASKEGRPGSVIDKLSAQFRVNDVSPNIRQIADYVKNSKPEVVVHDTEPIVSGDTAQITSDVSVKVNLLGERSLTVKDVQILFRKETATEWVVIPTTKWRLTEVKIDPSVLAGLQVQ